MMRKTIALITLATLLGCSSQPSVIDHSAEFSWTGENQVYIVSHGWHTGFVLPAENIYNAVPALRERFYPSPFIELGWGDKGFYQANEITSSLTLSAIFWPTESVVHAVAVPKNVDRYFKGSEIHTLCFNDEELDRLVNFVARSFYMNAQERVVHLKKGIYGDSQFYKGVGDYHLTNTCNTWTAKGLKSAGMDISPSLKLTASSIMSYTRDIEARLLQLRHAESRSLEAVHAETRDANDTIETFKCAR